MDTPFLVAVLALGLVVAVALGAALAVALGALRRDRADRGHALIGAATPEPLADALDRLARRVVEAERDRAAEQAGLRAEIREHLRHVDATTEALRRETGQLATALGRTSVRGRWGEAQLRRLVEAGGLLDRVHFVEQDTRDSGEGRLRPDLVIDLGAGRRLVVDAKVPLTALLEAESCTDADEREAWLLRHAADVAGHAERLAAKDYWRQYDDAVEMVVLFLPAESMLGIALQSDPGLLERSFARNVVLATPTTFLAMARTIAHVWRRESLADHAREILALGTELHDRISVMSDHLRRLGSSLDGTVDHFNRLVGSYESRVLVSTRRLHELGVGQRPVTDVPAVTARARIPAEAIADPGRGITGVA